MLEPAAEDDLADVLIGMVAHAVEGACAGPEHRLRQVVGYRSTMALKNSTAVV